MANEYKIKDVNDFLKVPRDRVAICINEFLSFVLSIQDRKTLVDLSCFTWIDDGEKNVTINIY